jgi:DNA-binding beta-propeller fold protein YncE
VNTIPVGVRPVWADLASGLDELVVANEGNGTTPGSVTIVSIPLCSAAALPTNPNCNASNPIDAATFGNVVATIPVGINPIMVSVLSDYTRAYVANAGVAGLPCAANGVAVPGVSTTCTISVVNLATNTVTATIPINGHPAWIATTAAVPTGKVYVVCKDSQVMTVIETDTDSVDTTVPLQGFGVSVRMTQP